MTQDLSDPLKSFVSRLHLTHPTLKVSCDVPDAPTGSTWLDIRTDKALIVVEYHPEFGFGFSDLPKEEELYGTPSSRFVSTADAALNEIYRRLDDVKTVTKTPGLATRVYRKAIKNAPIDVTDAAIDLRKMASTLGLISAMLEARGGHFEARRLRHEQLAVLERIGDQRELAVAMGHMADFLQVHGDLDQALQMRRKQLGILDRLRDAMTATPRARQGA